MKTRLHQAALIGPALLLLACKTTAASLTALGHLAAANPSSFGTGLTPDGRFVIGYSNSGSGAEAFRWSLAEGMVGLGDLPGGDFRSEAKGISSDGSIVVGWASSDISRGIEPFRWTKSGGLSRLGESLPPGILAAEAGGITPDGRLVVGSFLSDTGEAGSYRWTANGGFSLLPEPSGGNSPRNPVAVAVSADGQTVAGYMERPSEGFRWTAETGVVALGRQAGGKPVECDVYDMSADGRYIVGLVVHEDTRNLEMMRWSAERGIELLGYFPKGESRSIAYGVSDDGRMVVGEAVMEVNTPGFPFPMLLPRAAVWQEGSGLRTLWDLLVERGVNPSSQGWESLFIAQAVSGDGRFVVGSGRRNGKIEAFLANLTLPLEFTRTTDGLRLTWPAAFKLQRTRSLAPALWEDVPGAVPPLQVPTDGEPAFFRIAAAP